MEARGAPLRVHETPEDTWDATMAVNAKSVFYCCKYVIAQMLRQDVRDGHRGWIINMSSIFGLVGGRANSKFFSMRLEIMGTYEELIQRSIVCRIQGGGGKYDQAGRAGLCRG